MQWSPVIQYRFLRYISSVFSECNVLTRRITTIWRYWKNCGRNALFRKQADSLNYSAIYFDDHENYIMSTDIGFFYVTFLFMFCTRSLHRSAFAVYQPTFSTPLLNTPTTWPQPKQAPSATPAPSAHGGKNPQSTKSTQPVSAPQARMRPTAAWAIFPA